MGEPIDANRGVMYKRSKAAGNISVYMYLDQPGFYYDAHGNEVNEKVARLAGYPVDKFRKARIKAERMASAMSAIEAELDYGADDGAPEVLKEGGGYKVLGMPLGNANVVDDEGGILNPVPISREQATMLWEKLTGKEPALQKASEKKA